jgi:hypothetical protein
MCDARRRPLCGQRQVALLAVHFGKTRLGLGEESDHLAGLGCRARGFKVLGNARRLLPGLRDLRQDRAKLDLLDTAIAAAGLCEGGLSEPLRLVVLLQLDEREHLRAGGHERKARIWVLASQCKRAVHEAVGDRGITSEEQAVADGAEVAKLTTDVPQLARRVHRLLDSLGRFPGVAAKEGDHPELAVRAVFPRGVAELSSQFTDLLPVAERGQNVPLQVDVSFDGEAPQPEATIVRRERLRQLAAELLGQGPKRTDLHLRAKPTESGIRCGVSVASGERRLLC